VPHPVEYTGEESATKRQRLGESMGADSTARTAPASIAWLFNVRGGDVIRTPLPIGQAILNRDGTARLFLDEQKWSPELAQWLGNAVSLEPSHALPAALDSLKGRKVLVDPSQSSSWYFDRLTAAGAEVIRGMDPCTLPRAAKNAVEVQGARNAHARDGAALTKFLHWIATEAQETLPDEIEIAAKLEGLRDQTGALKDLSFDSIAAAGPNGAYPHYHPTHRTTRRMEKGNLLLVDSGGQYLDGTTDVTRTMAVGAPSAEMIRMFTLVLKGHIALARVRFPAGTTGHALDALARLPMWAAGLDYDHGTGHGVGSYLGVHEGPHRISKAPNAIALLPGMIVSNEPGYYQVGGYGIRIENLQVVTAAEDVPGGERPMMGFESLTLAPIDRQLIDPSLLDADEARWLNDYHARVLKVIGQQLKGETRAWLEQVTAPI
jgi:Xaa-Pro aminopeptidase